MAEQGIDLAELAVALGLPVSRAHDLLDGNAPISIEMARRISGAIGGSVEFWLARDGQFREDLNTVATDAWAAKLPIADMAAMGWIPATPATWRERMATSLEFFGVRDYRSWQQRYGSLAQTARFRFSPASKPDATSVIAWLRRAEQEAEGSELASWDRTTFAALLPQARVLTTDRDPARFLPALMSLCASAGVSLVVIRTPRHCLASGAARFLAPDRAQIVLSARYLSDDHLWFTFFHEAAHLILHDSTATYIDEFEEVVGAASSKQEQEADTFAGDFLLPPKIRDQLRHHSPKPREILTAARAAAISPGIVVGQLQHLGTLGFATKFNGFKRRYRWNGPTLGRA